MSVIWIDEEEGIWPLAAYSGPLALSKGVTRGRRRASLRGVERECAFLLARGSIIWRGSDWMGSRIEDGEHYLTFV